MIGLVLLPRLVGSRGTEWDLALVSDAPAGVAESFASALGRPAESTDDNTYKVTRIDGTVDAARDRLAARLLAKEFDGYIALPADVLQSGNVVFRARKSGSFAVIRDLRTAGTRAVQSERLKRSGIDASAIAALVAPVRDRRGENHRARRGARRRAVHVPHRLHRRVPHLPDDDALRRRGDAQRAGREDEPDRRSAHEHHPCVAPDGRKDHRRRLRRGRAGGDLGGDYDRRSSRRPTSWARGSPCRTRCCRRST